MKIKIIISIVLIYSFLFNSVFAGILFSEIFPNTIDDTNLEYLELYNSGNLDIYLSGYLLKDKLGKEYIFGSGNFLEYGKRKKYFRNDTKILLNNSNEEIYLFDGSGNLLDSFSYTGSIKGEVIKIINFGTGNIENNTLTGIINTGSIDTNTGIIENGNGNIENNTGSIEENNLGIIKDGSGVINNNSKEVVEIFKLQFSFQNPSYILEKDKIKNKYICDNTKEECKLNLDLRNSFSGSFKEKDYICYLDFGFKGWLNGEENKCNPGTIIFPKGKYDLKFKIIEKTNTGNVFTGGFILENNIEPEIIEKEVIKEKIVEVEKIVYKEKEKIENKIIIEKPKIIIQSGLDENNNCKKEECSINLKYEEKNKLEKCEWNFNGGKFKNGTELKCNPGYVKYGFGNYQIKLKVYEKDNKNNFREEILEFKNFKKEKNKSIKSKNSKEISEDKFNELKIENKYKNKFIRNIKLGDININPKGKDDNEYVEIINYSSGKINLYGCSLDDKINGGSKKYIFKQDSFLENKEIKKIYKKESKIIFNNASDEVNLICDGNVVDNFSRNFFIKEEYILNKEKLIVRNKIEEINKVLKAKNEKVNFESKIISGNINEKVFSGENKIISNEIKIKEKLEANIIVQGKIGTNKILKGNNITCFDTCSINFDGSKSKGNIKKYLWDFGNGKVYEGKNPDYIKYEKLGKYSVVLKIISNDDLESKMNFLVNFIKTPKKIKTSKSKKIFNNYLDNKEEIFFDKKPLEEINKKNDINKKTNTKAEILFYILIFIFSLNLIVLILRREKLL